jgi:hypothetical protein
MAVLTTAAAIATVVPHGERAGTAPAYARWSDYGGSADSM